MKRGLRQLFESNDLFYLSARKQSLVGPLPGANVKSYAGYLTVNKKYNSNLYFWFFPAQVHYTTMCPKWHYFVVHYL
jgi:hypothetical protein